MALLKLNFILLEMVNYILILVFRTTIENFDILEMNGTCFFFQNVIALWIVETVFMEPNM